MCATWNGFDPAALLISGVQEAVEAGTYEVIFSPKQGYYWTDNGGNESRSAFWTIGRIVVEVPSQSNAPVYNGESQSPTWEGYQPDIMTLAGDTIGTGAGEYAANLILDNNYQWPDGTTGAKEVSWAIAPAAGSITLDKSSLELRASLMSGVITVTRPGDGAITASSGNTSIATVSVDGNEVTVTAKAKGSVNITIAVGAGTNHTAPASQTVSVTVTLPTTVLNDNSWATIQDVAASGNAANYWSVGDMVASDYVGLVSANKEPEKMEKAGFTTTKSEFVNAPVINELPVTLECELKEIIDGSKYIGKIVNVSADESVLGEDGKIDLQKFHPIILDGTSAGYYAFGERVGKDNSLDIQIRIAEIDAEFKAMLQAIATDTVEDFDEQRATALMAEKNSLEQQLSQYGNAQQEREKTESRLDEIFTVLEGLENHPMEYNDRLVRQVLECVVVESKNKIKVIFAGGLEVEQAVETV